MWLYLTEYTYKSEMRIIRRKQIGVVVLVVVVVVVIVVVVVVVLVVVVLET